MAGMALVLLVVLAIDQGRVVMSFARHWANEDHTLMWYASREILGGRWHQPQFYGQAYSTIFAAAPAAALSLLRVRYSTGVQLSGAFLMTACWLVLALGAWLRGHRLVALVGLATPVVLSSDYGVWGSMQARAPGSLAAAVGVALLLAWPRSGLALFGFSLLGALGFAWDNGSVLLLVPAAVYAVTLHHRSVRTLIPGALGVLPAVAYQLWSARIIADHPDYDLHATLLLRPDLGVLGDSLAHLDRYLTYLAPELLRWWPVPLVVLAALAGALLFTRRPRFVLPALAALAVTALVLATPKALDGTASVFLPFGRIVESCATMTFFVGYLVAEAGIVRQQPRVTAAAAAAVLALSLATFGVRQATFHDRYDALAVVAAHSAAPVGNTRDIGARCGQLFDVAQRSHAALVVFRADRTAAYACAAEPRLELITLFPLYDRRAWQLHRENHVARTRFLVTEVDETWCQSARAHYPCTIDPSVPDVALVETPPQPVVPTLRELGFEVRPFDPVPAS
jgi:hypothetical protein